tara:strand:+ start:250 stop:657 length:408 start_codon:yes stop_codon:yes gene_type:complete
MKIIKLFLILFATLSSINLFAQNTSNATVPAEAWFCEINEGYSMKDIRAVSKGVEENGRKNGLKSSQFIFTTFMGPMNPNAFVLMTVWPSFDDMGKGFQDFFTNGSGDKIYSDWLAATTCSQRNLLTVENTYNID